MLKLRLEASKGLQNISTCAVGWAFLANANPEWLDR
jgi:hypothetical protein